MTDARSNTRECSVRSAATLPAPLCPPLQCDGPLLTPALEVDTSLGLRDAQGKPYAASACDSGIGMSPLSTKPPTLDEEHVPTCSPKDSLCTYPKRSERVIDRSTARPSLMSGGYTDRPISYPMVDSVQALRHVLDLILYLPKSKPSIYVDVEGPRLGRYGDISFMTLLFQPLDTIFVVDVMTLGNKAFSTPSSCGMTLKAILESEEPGKVFFDVRSPSDALARLYGIHLNGVQEVQLMELVTRRRSQRYLNGLSKCVQNDCNLSPVEEHVWLAVKRRSQELCNPFFGGNDRILSERPLPADIIRSCLQNVVRLSALWNVYWMRQSPKSMYKVALATADRIRLSQMDEYDSQGEHMSLGPWYR